MKKGGGTGTLSRWSLVHSIFAYRNQSYVWVPFGFRRNWKRRWFVLKDETLTYYENDQEGAKALGVIDIRKAS